MERYYLSLFKHTKLLLFLMLLVIIFFAYSAKEFKLDASSDTLILENDEDLKKYREIINNYGSSDFLIVTFTDKNKILSFENLEIIKSFITEVNSYHWVENTQSIFDVPLLQVNNQSLTDLVNEIQTIETKGVNLADAENEILNSPIFKNLIISEDASSTGVLINFKRDTKHEFLINEKNKVNDLSNASNIDLDYKKQILSEYELSKIKSDIERHNNINQIRNTISKLINNNLEIHLGGVAMIADDTITFVKNDILVFGFFAILFILIVLFIIFKNPVWMLACISNCIASLTIMLGTVSLLGWKVTVISSNFIMLMLILSLSMTVHIVVRYRQLLLENNEINHNQIIILTLKKMYKPCLFAALTTIFAFATLYTSGIKPVMDFGLMMCAGIGITYIISFLFLPLLLNFFDLKKINKNIYLSKSYLAEISQKSPNLLILFFLMIFILGLYGTTKLEVENSFIDYFKKDTEIYKGMKLIDDKLGGTTPLDIVINFNYAKDDYNEDDELLDFGIEYDPADYWFTKEKIDIIKKIHDHLEEYPFAGKVLSLASVVRTAEGLNRNNEFDTLELSVLYKKLPQELKDQIIKPYVLIGKDQARITMRIIDTHPELKRSDFINNLNTYIAENYSNNNINVSVAGILVLYNNMLNSLFNSQIKSLSIVLFGIFLMLLILFRSFKIAIATIFPNLIACFVILGTMGLFSIPLDLMTITIAAITIGIAIDNNIHYVYRYREYFAESKDHNITIKKCSNTVGIAIRNTSYTIIAGFSILIFSNFYPTIYFGIFTALAMFLALLGSLTLLPILIRKFNTL